MFPYYSSLIDLFTFLMSRELVNFALTLSSAPGIFNMLVIIIFAVQTFNTHLQN